MSLGQPRGSSSSSLLDVHINCGAKKGKGDVKADLARGDQGRKASLGVIQPVSRAELCADCIRAWSEQRARGWEGSSAWVPAGPRSLPLRKLPGICVFSMQHRQDAEGWERDRFPSAVNRLGVGYGGWDLTLACSFHLQKEATS